MAHLEPMGLEALEKMARGLADLGGNVDEVAKKCVNTADPTLENAYQGALSGSMPSAARMTLTTPANTNHLGVYSVSHPVGFDPSSPSKARYAMLAAFAEYGVGAHVIPFKSPNAFGKMQFDHPGVRKWPKPFHARAVAAAFAPTKAIVEQTFKAEVDRLVKL